VEQFTTSTGTQIAYADTGMGRPILLLHGLLAHGGFFPAQQPLADAFRVISVDLRGHGRSAAGGDPSFDRIAADVAELVAALELRDAIGIGWSLGAAVLWRVLAGAEGKRFAGSVIIDMTPRVLNDGDWQLGLSRELCEARGAAMLSDFQAFRRRRGAGDLRPAALRRHARAGGLGQRRVRP
jgi:pimeloyl-[acyl-carrier protein] methyl ester esterase